MKVFLFCPGVERKRGICLWWPRCLATGVSWLPAASVVRAGPRRAKSSHAMAAPETKKNMSFIISPLQRGPSFSSAIKTQLKKKNGLSPSEPTAHSQLRKFSFHIDGESRWEWFKLTRGAAAGKQLLFFFLFVSKMAHQLWLGLWWAAKAFWIRCQSANAIPGLK